MVLDSAEKRDRLPARERAGAASAARRIRSTAWGWRCKGRTAEAAVGARPGGRRCWPRSSPSRAAGAVDLLRAHGQVLHRGRRRSFRDETRGLAAAAREQPLARASCPGSSCSPPTRTYRLGRLGRGRARCRGRRRERRGIGPARPALDRARRSAARIHAARGREQAARDRCAPRGRDRRAGRLRQPAGSGRWRASASSSSGSVGTDEAIEELEQADKCSPASSGLEDPLIVPWAPDLVEAYARAGREAEAAASSRRSLGEPGRAQRRRRSPWRSPRAAGDCVAEAAFESAFERALELHARGRLTVRARTHPARVRLAPAPRAAPGRGARAPARSARGLRATSAPRPWTSAGARTSSAPRARSSAARFSDPDELTAQEVRVARASRAGRRTARSRRSSS